MIAQTNVRLDITVLLHAMPTSRTQRLDIHYSIRHPPNQKKKKASHNRLLIQKHTPVLGINLNQCLHVHVCITKFGVTDDLY